MKKNQNNIDMFHFLISYPTMLCFYKAVFSGSWVSDPSKKEDRLQKRKLAQLPGCKPDPTNWRWLKKNLLGKAKGKECKWQSLWEKGCFVDESFW